jgi:hypothetical protein
MPKYPEKPPATEMLRPSFELSDFAGHLLIMPQ